MAILPNNVRWGSKVLQSWYPIDQDTAEPLLATNPTMHK